MAKRSSQLVEGSRIEDTNHIQTPVPGSLVQNAFLVAHDVAVSLGERIDAYGRGLSPAARREDRVKLMEAAGIFGSDKTWVTLSGRDGNKSRRVLMCDVSITMAKKFLGIADSNEEGSQ